MLLFLDSADLSKIEAALRRYPLDGVTTNPTILARDIKPDTPLRELLFSIRRLTDGKKLFVQVTADDADGMVRDAQTIVKTLGGDVTVKIPSTAEGFEAIRVLKGLRVSTAATACYSPSQALLAAKSGADFVAPYISHLDNLSLDGAAAAGEMARLFTAHGLPTQVLAASFRTAAQVERCLACGVTAVTVTAEMLDTLSAHPGTDRELDAFRKNWSARFDSGIEKLL